LNRESKAEKAVSFLVPRYTNRCAVVFYIVNLQQKGTMSTSAARTFQDLQVAVDDRVTAHRSTPWTATLPFKGHLSSLSGNFTESEEAVLNLFAYTNKLYKVDNMVIRFDPEQYPLDGAFPGIGGKNSSLI
jgi:hypothetical protein